MAKIYLFMIVCLYDPNLSLENTCRVFPQPEPFETIMQCLDQGEAVRKVLIEDNENIYPSFFCSNKNLQSVSF